MLLIAIGIHLALGDSISIDDYTGVRGGGAPSQLARELGIELVDLTRDGNTTQGVLADLARAPAAADVVTLTAGGNDLLLGDRPRAILRRLHLIAERIQPLGARVVLSTVSIQAMATTMSDVASSDFRVWQRSSYGDA
jgi:lysophospholipase L1-like esterase